MNTSVACAIGPSVNTFRIKKTYVNTLRAQLIFPSKPSFFAICLNFQQQNSLKNQYLPQLSSENCEINSIKFDSPKAFQKHQEHLQIPMQFSVSIFYSFIEKMVQ
jgi:hypothetical protein